MIDNTKKIPVTVVTGFLGSGKTSLVNALIKLIPDKKVGVIVNEFGEKGVDSDLLETNEEFKVQVSNGCACCVVRDDLEKGAEELIKRYPDIDYLIVEASGLAEPLPIAQTFMHNLALNKQTYLDGLICVIDSQNFVKNWDEFATLKDQIDYSDFIVLSKTNQDLASTMKTRELVSKIRPGAVVLDFNLQDTAKLKVLLDTQSFTLTEEIKHEMEHEHHHHHEDDHFSELVYTSKTYLDPQALDKAFLGSEFAKIIRAKGFLNLAHQPEVSHLFQLVGHGRQLSAYSHKVEENRLVLIGKDFDAAQILQSIKNCEVQV